MQSENTDFNENQQREQLQLQFNRCFANGNRSVLHRQYRFLRQLEFNYNTDYDNKIIDVSALAESISTACDILLSESGASVIFCGNKTAPAICNQRHFTKALLNLISNAYLYGCGKLITVKAVETPDFIRVEVRSGGAFINNGTGNGLDFVGKICKNANGRFFIEQTSTDTRAVMIFEKTRNYEAQSTVDFCSLLNDRLSPVYIELFGMEYH